MPAQLLIYESAAPVSFGRHAQWSVEVGGDYAFSKRVNSVPRMAVEFSNAAPEYPIVFAGSDDNLVPAVILGMRADENLFLNQQGGWAAKYIPAFVRRYPFVFASSADGKTFTLCIDEAFHGCNQQGRGQRLFGDDGKPTAYVENVLKFLEQYQVEHRRTQALCKKLQELNLLEPMRAQFKFGSGEERALTGFMAVSRARIKTLGPEVLAELVRTDHLELIYLHLQSMQHFAGIMDRLGAERGARADETAEADQVPRRHDEASNPGKEKGAEKKHPVKAGK